MTAVIFILTMNIQTASASFQWIISFHWLRGCVWFSKVTNMNLMYMPFMMDWKDYWTLCLKTLLTWSQLSHNVRFFSSFSLTDSYASAKQREEWTEIESKRLTCVAQEGKEKKQKETLNYNKCIFNLILLPITTSNTACFNLVIFPAQFLTWRLILSSGKSIYKYIYIYCDEN